MSDPYVRVVLTVIALALVAIAVRGPLIPPAYAQSTVNCRIQGPIEVRPIEVRSVGQVREIGGTVRVEARSGFSAPGTSSTSPLHVRVAQ